MREPYIRRNRAAVYLGDVREVLAEMDSESVHCCITSPPYYSLRDYGVDGQIGLEETPEEYIAALVDVFSEVRRVMREDATLWLNLGDSYAATTKGSGGHNPKQDSNKGSWFEDRRSAIPGGLKPKDLMMMPARVALALQADGWWLRSAFPWVKANPMPESVTDRPSSSIEYIFLLSKSQTYFWDGDAVRTPQTVGSLERFAPGKAQRPNGHKGDGEFGVRAYDTPAGILPNGRNRRNGDWWRESLDLAIDAYRVQLAHMEHVRDNGGLLLGEDGLPLGLSIATEAVPFAHFACFPQALVEPLVRAGTSERGVCSECGAPWRRVVERRPMVIARSGRREAMGEQGRTQASGTMLEPVSSITTGWAPTCICDAGEPVEAVVLDPFSGSGTTLLVAQRLGRRGVGIEIKAEYADISGRRLAQDVLL